MWAASRCFCGQPEFYGDKSAKLDSLLQRIAQRLNRSCIAKNEIVEKGMLSRFVQNPLRGIDKPSCVDSQRAVALPEKNSHRAGDGLGDGTNVSGHGFIVQVIKAAGISKRLVSDRVHKCAIEVLMVMSTQMKM